jgi:hypothetical protein
MSPLKIRKKGPWPNRIEATFLLMLYVGRETDAFQGENVSFLAADGRTPVRA